MHSSDILGDSRRLAALQDAGLYDTDPIPSLDRIARVAVGTLRVPAAGVSIVDADGQFFRSAAGFPAGRHDGTGRSVLSFCEYAVIAGAELVIERVDAHPLVAENPELGRAGIGAYAGIPLVTVDGLVLGTLCAIDIRPRSWDAEHLAALRDLAALAAAEIDARRSGAISKRTDHTLRSSEARFRGLVEQSLAGIYVVREGRFEYVNPRFAEIFGKRQEDLTHGALLVDVFAPEERERVAEDLRDRLEGDVQSGGREFRALRASGEVIHVELHGARTRVDGEPAVIGLLLDVSERKRTEAEHEAAVAARDRFYAMVSHELRTPISAIMLHNELLLTGMYGTLGEEQREGVERSQHSARFLLHLINDLLDLSKLEARKMERRMEDVDLTALIDEVLSTLEPLAAEHGCTLVHSPAGAPLRVLSDAQRIRQILFNLLSNAIKFGEGEPVEVRCSLVGPEAVIEVEDRGVGIPPEELERIFEDFVQLGTQQGTGLGLPIARRLAELLEGTLDVRSTVGSGSIFSLRIPAAAG